ncbi:MAG: adenine phosphoribosyltransferase [Oscillospiraceae bacterium]|nr:adenine phosphoribosyltransferase [Oscillospiraceae bacterium]
MEIKYTGQEYYDIDLAGRTERLVIAPVHPTLHIAGFVLLGNTELTNYCAKVLADKLKDVDFDYIVCPEAKVLPLAQSLCTQMGNVEFVVFRKGKKAYMLDAIETEVKSITTANVQKMVVDAADAAKIRGKKVLLLDDVVSTGGTFRAMEVLLDQIGTEIVGYSAVLREGTDFPDDKLYYVSDLPIFVG